MPVMKAFRPQNVIVGLHLDEPISELPLLGHCGDEVCSGRHRIPRHRHDRFEFCYVSEGQALWRMGKEVVRQHPGEMLIAYPNQWHELVDHPHEKYHILYAAVDLQRLGASGQSLAEELLRRRLSLLPRAQEAETILRGLVRQAASQQPLRAMVAESLLNTLVALITQSLTPESPQAHRSAAGPHSYPIETAIAFMRGRLDQRLSTEDLAQVANYSAGHFVRQFNKEVGVTPADFHLRLRLEAARDELRQPDFSVTVAAMHFGFSSSQHFSRAFRQTFGMTPRQWQRVETESDDRPRIN